MTDVTHVTNVTNVTDVTNVTVMSFHENHIELAKKLSNSPHVLCTQHLIEDGEPIPKYFLKPDSEEFYWCSNYQFSIHPKNNNKLSDVLNEDGKVLYNNIRKLVLSSIPQKTIDVYTLEYVNSGSWFADQTSKYYLNANDKIKGAFNSFDNISIKGRIIGTKTWINTSPCIFVNIEEGWCFTKNGSIYKLLEHKTFLEIEDLMYSDTFKIEVGHDHKVEQ